MYGINKVILVGTVGKDPETVTFSDGGKLIRLSFVTEKRAYKTQSGHEVPKRVDWHNVTVRGNLVSVTEKYVKKGTNLYIEGELVNRKFTTKDGQNRMTTEINVVEMHMLPESLSKKQRDYLKTFNENDENNDPQSQTQNQAQAYAQTLNGATGGQQAFIPDAGNESYDDSYLTI